MRVEVLTKENEDRWAEFVDSHLQSNIYHRLEWKEIIEGAYRYRPFYLMAVEGKDIRGVLPMFEVRSAFFGNRLVSLPYSHSVGVLSSDRQATESLVGFSKSLVVDRGLDYLEIKERPEATLPGLRENLHYICSFLSLKRPVDEIWKGFDKSSVRWGIKKAEKSGIEVREGAGISDYRRFYSMLLETRKHQGLPAYPFSLFEGIHRNLGSNSRLYLAYKNSVCIAGLVMFFCGKTGVYAYVAARRETEYLTLQPNNLLLWRAINWSRDNGLEVFDFGITPPEHRNLLLFKSRWGTKNIKVPYYYYLNKISEPPLLDSMNPRFRLMTNLWKRVPIFISKRVGPRILRHTG